MSPPNPVRLFPLHRRVLFLVVAFLLIGEIMLFSATAVLGIQRYGSEFYYLVRQSICAAGGLIVALVLSRIRYQFWARLAFPLLFCQILLVSGTYLSGLGHHALGASRWLRFGFLAFQPSEIAKITVTIYLARLLAVRHNSKYSLEQWGFYLAPVATLLVLIFKQPDLGTTVLLTIIGIGLFFIAGMRAVHCFAFFGSGAVLFAVSMLQSAYRRRRVFAFLNPWEDPQGRGFQTIQSFLSFHSGKVFGVGIGNGNSKLFFLPEVHTDFIFSLIGEELGFVGAAAVLLLFVYFSYLLLKACLHAPDAFGRYLAFGLSLSLMLQIAVNLGGVTGLLPIKGLPLPFLSWGRSALLVNLVIVGILLNIIRQSGIIEPSSAPAKR